MASQKNGIEWTDETWNPLRGCSRVSEGCRHCYAEGVARRFSGPGLPYEGLIARGGQWNGQIKLVPELLDQPLRWRRPRRIFVNSMSDLFHENVPTEFIDQVFAVMAMADEHTFQVLTKRPERMRSYLSDEGLTRRLLSAAYRIDQEKWAWLSADFHIVGCQVLPLPNVWLGVSVEDQAAADERIPLLLQTPAAVRWISAEPLLGPVDLEDYDTTQAGIDWVVVGGESGREARPMHPDWARALRDQCAAAGVPFLFKQWGEWAPNWLNDDQGNMQPGSEWMDRMGKKIAGRHLDGVLHDGYPEVHS